LLRRPALAARLVVVKIPAGLDAEGQARVSDGDGTGGVACATGEDVAARKCEGCAAAPPIVLAAAMPSSRTSLIFVQPFLSAIFPGTKFITRSRSDTSSFLS